jgi:hypothetical protein
MKSTRVFIVAFLVLALCLAANPGGASLVDTSLPSGTVIAMPSVNYFGQGPQTVVPGITWSSTSSSSTFGFTGSYGFGENGPWDGTLGPMPGLNSSSFQGGPPTP